MRIKTFGAKHFTSQLPRIEEGFKELNHEIVNENADLIYSNDPTGFDDALKEKGVKIFNVLDIPEHLFPNYDLKKLDDQLMQATHITCISHTTKKQLKRFFNIRATAIKIIYQPAMPVFQINEKKYGYKYLMIGRNSDLNKRNWLALQYLQLYDSLNKCAALGNESPYMDVVDWYGIQPINVLNDFYNSVDYVFSLTKYGGIELSQIEAILAGKFPIVANDSQVAMEFNPEFACNPTPEGIHQKILEIEANPLKYKEIVANKQLDFFSKFDRIEVAKRIIGLIV